MASALVVGEMMCIPIAFHHYRILDDEDIQRCRNTNKKQDYVIQVSIPDYS